MTTRVMPPSGFTPTTANVNATVYKAAPGTTLDVPDSDAVALVGQGWSIIGAVGPTGSRIHTVTPTAPVYIDTTLNKTLFWDGAAYRDHTGKSF